MTGVYFFLFFAAASEQLLTGPGKMSASIQTASQVLEDLKTRIQTDDWALGGLIVIASFLATIITLLLFAAVFGCCSTPRNKASPR